MEENDVLEEEGVNTRMMLEDEAEEGEEEEEEEEDAEVVEDWSVYECLYLAQGLTGVTRVSRR